MQMGEPLSMDTVSYSSIVYTSPVFICIVFTTPVFILYYASC